MVNSRVALHRNSNNNSNTASVKSSFFARALRIVACFVLATQVYFFVFVVGRSGTETGDSKVGVKSSSRNTRRNATATVAYAISLIKCSDKQTSDAGLIDAALVMRHSIHKTSIRNPQSGSKYDYKMYALVHKQAAPCSSVLKNAGFNVVIIEESPIKPSEIQGEYIVR